MSEDRVPIETLEEGDPIHERIEWEECVKQLEATPAMSWDTPWRQPRQLGGDEE